MWGRLLPCADASPDRLAHCLRSACRFLSAEAQLTSQAGKRSQAQQGEEGGAAEDGTGAVQRSAGGGGGQSGPSVSADFHFWLALLRTLLPHVQQLQGEQGSAGAAQQLGEAVG